MLKIIIAIGATFITALNLWLYGDGQSIAALFGLYGVLLGHQIGKAKKTD